MAKKNAKPSPEDDWEAERDLNHLVQAKEIMGDRKRHKRALDLAKKQMKALEGVNSD